MLSPASLYLLTVVACTRSWSQMAALWRSIHRRTGETTVRISMATQQIRNWVRKLTYVCYSCVCVYRYLAECTGTGTDAQVRTRQSPSVGRSGHAWFHLQLPTSARCWSFGDMGTSKPKDRIPHSELHRKLGDKILCHFKYLVPPSSKMLPRALTLGSADIDVTIFFFLHPKSFFFSVCDLEKVLSQTAI